LIIYAENTCGKANSFSCHVFQLLGFSNQKEYFTTDAFVGLN
jgi:hypothetical protein